MAKFNVHFYETAAYSVPVDADSEDEAISIAEEMFYTNRDSFYMDSEVVDCEAEKVDDLH